MHDPILRNRRIKVALAAVAVGITVSALLATALVYLARG